MYGISVVGQGLVFYRFQQVRSLTLHPTHSRLFHMWSTLTEVAPWGTFTKAAQPEPPTVGFLKSQGVIVARMALN